MKLRQHKKPGPVLLTLSRIVLRDNILCKKGDLQACPGLNTIFVNADEPIEVRRAKSFLRKASYHARRLGEVVSFKHDQVTINGIPYTTEDVSKIPAKYLSDNVGEVKETAGAEAMEVPDVPNTDEANKSSKSNLIRSGERMRITSKGLLFSGPTAYLSNMAYIPVTHKKLPFESNEQGYQWRKAINHKDEELAKEIIETKGNSYEVKSAGGLITASQEWNDMAPDVLEELFEEKLDQNPDTLKRLIDTFPLDLIEASVDKTWGGGAPFSSPVYDGDQPLPGENVFGKIATKCRNRRIDRMKVS